MKRVDYDKKTQDYILQRYSKYIDTINDSIHSVVDMENLSDYEKRKVIFNAICEIHDFDYDNFYDKILNKFYFTNIHIFNSLTEGSPYYKSRKDMEDCSGETIEIDDDKNLESFYLSDCIRFREMLIDFLNKYDCYSDELVDCLIERVKCGEFSIKLDLFNETINLVTKQLISNEEANYLYKALLEKNGIYSICVVCDNNLPLEHEICLVYDSNTDKFSFDDISSFLCNRGTIDECFDYDIEGAKRLKQGFRALEMFKDNGFENDFGVALSSYHSGLIINDSSKNEWYKSFGIEDDNSIYYHLPENIKSIKKYNSK